MHDRMTKRELRALLEWVELLAEVRGTLVTSLKRENDALRQRNARLRTVARLADHTQRLRVTDVHDPVPLANAITRCREAGDLGEPFDMALEEYLHFGVTPFPLGLGKAAPAEDEA